MADLEPGVVLSPSTEDAMIRLVRSSPWAVIADRAQRAKARPDLFVGSEADDCILELRARVEALEGKYETQRLATLEWGADVDKVKRWSDQHLQRIMALEAAANSSADLTSSAPAGSLVGRVAQAISHDGCKAYVALYGEEARAAIREVAAWLRESDAKCEMGGDATATADLLVEEADRG